MPMPAQATAAEVINPHGSKQTNTQPTDSNELTQQCDKISSSTAYADSEWSHADRLTDASGRVGAMRKSEHNPSLSRARAHAWEAHFALLLRSTARGAFGLKA